MTDAALTGRGPQTDGSRASSIGLVAGIGLIGLVFAWAQSTMISGAVIAPGAAVVRGKPKQVQSLDGGIAEEILVADGDMVSAGQVLIRLDPTLLRINLEMYRNQLAEEVALRSRLEAERAGLPEIRFDQGLTYLDGISHERIHAGQSEIFKARREVLRGRKAQLREKIEQFRNQITGVEALLAAKREQLDYIEQELEDLVALQRQGLAREGQVLDLQRGRASLLGDIAQNQADLAGIRNSIQETEMEILQSERQFQEQVVTDLREVSKRVEELILKIVTAQKQLERIEIVAPVSGIVHEMRIFTVGGVVPPGETILQVIPVGQGVEFEVRVDPRAIDQVAIGQSARVVFPAFSSRTTPEVFGRVSGISANSVTDPATGQSFYRVGLSIPDAELAKLDREKIIPGMPVEAFLQTGERSVLSYLLRPLADQLDRAFREE